MEDCGGICWSGEMETSWTAHLGSAAKGSGVFFGQTLLHLATTSAEKDSRPRKVRCRTSTLLATDLGVPLLARPAVISALLDEPAVAHDHRTSLLVNGITRAIILRTKGLVT